VQHACVACAGAEAPRAVIVLHPAWHSPRRWTKEHGRASALVPQKNELKNPFWRESRSLTFIVQLQFAPASVLQPKASDGSCRSSTDQGKLRPGTNFVFCQLFKSNLGQI